MEMYEKLAKMPWTQKQNQFRPECARIFCVRVVVVVVDDDDESQSIHVDLHSHFP